MYVYVCDGGVLHLYLFNTFSLIGVFICIYIDAGLFVEAGEKLLLDMISGSCEVVWKSRSSFPVPGSEFSSVGFPGCGEVY